MSYSQNDEERVILRWFGGKADGRFLDIGAFDGKQFSCTRALADMGWAGVCVEPGAQSFRSLMRNYVGNARVQLVCAAIGREFGLKRFFQSDDAISTLDDAHRAKWTEGGSTFQQTFVPVLTFAQLLDDFPPPYDFVKIDTEGTNLEVLEALPFDKLAAASLFCVEYEDRLPQMVKILSDRGYAELHRTSENVLCGRV